jgi:VWFA-related protein
MNRTIAPLAFVCALISAPSAQQPAAPAQPPSAPQPPLTFKVEVNYVEVDAVVTDASGTFVPSLTKDDFQVIEDGKPQNVSVFSKVEIPIEHADPPLYSRTAIPPDVASNAVPFAGRVFVLVLDDLHTKFQMTSRSKAAARLFIERYVGANDMVAVVNTSGFSNTAQDFTSNKQLALKAVDRAMGQRADSSTEARLQDYFQNRDTRGGSSDMNARSNELERYNQARNTMAVLKNLADYLAAIHGRRKAVVFFSEGLNYDVSNPIQNTYATEVQHATEEAIAAATRANVNIYSVDPRGVSSGMDDAITIQSFADDNSISSLDLQNEFRVQQDSLRVVADQTGGFAVLNQNDFRNGFSRILNDNSNYYVLGYYPTNDKRDGRFRSVQVKVLKPGLSVRTRKGYNAPKGKAAEAKAGSPEKTSPDLRDALFSPIPVSGLALSAFAAPFRGTAPKDAIALSIEIDGSKLNFKQTPQGTYANTLEVSLFASDDKGKVQDGAHDTANLNLKPQTYEIVSKSSFRLIRRIQVPPGRYSLRIGAREGNGGQVGSVIYDLDAPDFSKAPVTMSGIAITSAYYSHVPTASPDPKVNEFKDVLPSPPTAFRVFPRGDQLAIFAEVYDNTGSTPHHMNITASVLSDDGTVVFSNADDRRSEELKGAAGGGYGYTTKIPLTSWTPGRYVLRLEAKSSLGKGEGVKREVEFRVQ